MAHTKFLTGLAGVIAAATITAAPAQAAELGASLAPFEHAPVSPVGAETFDEASDYHRRRWRRYRRNRVDAGDVIAGVLVLGGIAAIASAASNNRNRNRYEDRRYQRRYDDRRYDDRRRTTRANGSGIDNAVDQCLAQIERDVRVESVDNATRGPSGWSVSGTLFNGAPFTCTIGNDGRIADIDYSGFAHGPVGGGDYAAGGQWSDDRYAEARLSARSSGYDGPRAVAVPPSTANRAEDLRPAYPGGPLPGESLAE
ncbi:hypothetical protein [Qipengyuania nanhaisediminis]|uniref:hypothetical protein n=1 Tax=Qipengyuania nanhaisediminis TaxID=604088 RepID=UPI0038B27484